MTMDQIDGVMQRLHAALLSVAPIHGVSIGRLDDRATWRVDFADTATQTQRLAAQDVVASFDLDAPTADDVRGEANRRMRELVNARDSDHLTVIVSNGTREAVRLQNKQLAHLADPANMPGLSDGEQLREAELRQLDDALERIRQASNLLEAAPVTDYREDHHWPALN